MAERHLVLSAFFAVLFAHFAVQAFDAALETA